MAALLLASSLVTTMATTADASTSSLNFRSPTLTASASRGSSALAVTIVNNTNHSVLLMSIDSPSAQSSMLFYDVNMCQGGQAMTRLNNIVIPAHATQTLGYRYQGSMFSGVTRPLHVGDTVTVNFHVVSTSLRSIAVSARVVPPPKGLRFRMAPMGTH
jgi:copper(I)-binding protein